MNNQPSVTVILAYRPRLFRELLHHALKTESPTIRVIEAADGVPSAALVSEASWLVVDEESAATITRLAATNPHMGILSLENRGSRARLIVPILPGLDQSLLDVPTLAGLINLLSHPVTEPEHQG